MVHAQYDILVTVAVQCITVVLSGECSAGKSKRSQVMESLDTPESTSSKFFGSPSEPIYTDSKHTLNADLLQDSLTLLSSKNDSVLSIIQESTVEKNKDDCMEFKSGSPILFLFELCRYFKLAPEVQYRAAELFHRFMISHIIELYQVNNYVVLST